MEKKSSIARTVMCHPYSSHQTTLSQPSPLFNLSVLLKVHTLSIFYSINLIIKKKRGEDGNNIKVDD